MLLGDDAFRLCRASTERSTSNRYARLDGVSDFTPPIIVPELVDLQMQQIYELGFERVRITLSFGNFGPDLLAAVPYVRACRALGIDVLGLLSDFGFSLALAQALNDPLRRDTVIDAYVAVFTAPVEPATPQVERAGETALQVFNEPTNFLGIAPEQYVRFLLAPTFAALKERAPGIVVVSAATVGRLDGVLRARRMFEAGLEDFCDVVAHHVYDLRQLEQLGGMARKPIWVTESGVRGPGAHLAWVTERFPEISERLGDVQHIYYFDLFDPEPGAFRLIDVYENEPGSFATRVESTNLVNHFSRRVAAAAGGARHATYRELIPDIREYFPTAEDLAIFGVDGIEL